MLDKGEVLVSSKIKEPWEEYPHIWPNSTAFFTYLRGCLRRAWMKSPVKHEYVKKHRHQISNPNPNGKKPTVWGFTCECCNEEFPISEGQVDHVHQAGTLRSTDDIQGFTERLLYVTDEDIQLVCKGCHGIITYAQKQGIAYEEAAIQKKAIAFSKLPIDDQRNFLTESGIDATKLTKPKMKQAYIEMLSNVL